MQTVFDKYALCHGFKNEEAPIKVVFPEVPDSTLKHKFCNQGFQNDVFGMRRPEGARYCSKNQNFGSSLLRISLTALPGFVLDSGRFSSDNKQKYIVSLHFLLQCSQWFPVCCWFPTPTHNSKQKQTNLCQKIHRCFLNLLLGSLSKYCFWFSFNIQLPKPAPFLVRNIHNTCFLSSAGKFHVASFNLDSLLCGLDHTNLVRTKQTTVAPLPA